MDKYTVAKIGIHGTKATVLESDDITMGLAGAVVQLIYDDDLWQGMRKKVTFRGTKKVDVLTDANVVELPWEVTTAKNVTVSIGITGVDAGEKTIIPTVWANIGTVKDSPYGAYPAPGEPVSPEWARVLEMIGDLRNLNTAEKSNLVAAINEAMSNSGGGTGGYYTPVVTQPTANTMQISFVPSVATMPAVEPVTVALPGSGSGQNVNLYTDFVVAETANAPQKLPIKTHAAGQNQPIHPKVLFLRNKFGGHYFWMAYTPYPYGADAQENPCIACSEDMVNWHTPDGVSNPLDSGTASAYMSDTHLLYNDKTGMLEIWYRHCDTSAGVETIYRRTSADGVAWNEREAMFAETQSGYSNIISPVIIYEDGIYKIWAGSGNPSGYLKYYESADGTNWELKAITNLMGWHFDVIHTDAGYEAFISDTQPGASVSYAVSDDGITWSEKTQLLTAGVSGNWDSSRLYRTSAIKENGIYYVFYTGVYNNVWGIGLTISQTKNDVTSIKGYVSGAASVKGGVNDYDSEIAELYDQVAKLNDLVVVLTARNDELDARISTLEAMRWEVTGVALDKTSLSINEGETAQLTATITPEDTPKTMIAWKSDNETVATVDGNGLVTAVGAGNCAIVCYAKSDETIKAECSVKVAGEVNVMKGVSLHDGYVNSNTGETGTSTTDVYTDAFNISGNDAIFVEFLSPAVSSTAISPYKTVFYNSANGFAGAAYTEKPYLDTNVPGSAVYCRIGSVKAGLTKINIYNIADITDLSDALAGQYYDAANGTLKTENGIYCIRIPMVAGKKYVINGCVSGCMVDSNNAWLSALTYDVSAQKRTVIADSDGFICINYRDASAVSVYESVDRIGHLTV